MSDRRAELESAPWGGRTRRYDLIKEGVVAVVIVAILVAALSTLFGSPDDKQVTFKEWATAAPVADALKQWQGSDAKLQSTWATNYDNALTKVNQDQSKVPAGNYGPVPELAAGLLTMAQAGSLDGALLSQGNYFQTDNTKQTLFLGDGTYFNDKSTASNLQGSTWGMMNETGRYPGQAWLWLYSFWYQIPPFNNEESHPFGANADAWIMVIMGALSLGLIIMPLIPIVNRLPYKIKIHRLVWKNYYQEENL